MSKKNKILLAEQKEIEAKLAAITEQEQEDTARRAGRRPLHIVEDAEYEATEITETVVSYDGTTTYEAPATEYACASALTHRDRASRKGDKADHRARKAAYEAIKGPHDSRYEWRRDVANLERLTKYGAKHLGDYCYVSKVMSYNRDDRLADGRGYDPYCHGDKFAKPVLREKAKTADALADTEILTEDLGSLWDNEYSLPHLLLSAADDINYYVTKKIRENLRPAVTLTRRDAYQLASDGFLSEKAFLGIKTQKNEVENLMMIIQYSKKHYAEDEEAIDLLNEAAETLEGVIRILP